MKTIIFTLNQNLSYLGINELSFLNFFKLLFLILFLLANACLLYSEYLENKHKDNLNSFTKSGIGNEFKKFAGNALIALSAIASGITIKDEYNKRTQIIESYVEKGRRFSEEIMKKREENKILEMLENAPRKSMILNLDELLLSYESMSGILKVAVTMVLSSSMIIWCLVGIILNLYGNYLLDRFNLEKRYPKIALIINYRRKLSKYYLISNFFFIISACLVNILLGLSIFYLHL